MMQQVWELWPADTSIRRHFENSQGNRESDYYKCLWRLWVSTDLRLHFGWVDAKQSVCDMKIMINKKRVEKARICCWNGRNRGEVSPEFTNSNHNCNSINGPWRLKMSTNEAAMMSFPARFQKRSVILTRRLVACLMFIFILDWFP